MVRFLAVTERVQELIAIRSLKSLPSLTGVKAIQIRGCNFGIVRNAELSVGLKV